MKIQKSLLIAEVLLITATAYSAQPPPNDDFANRIVLTGNDVIFTGTVAGATYELSPDGFGEVWGCCGVFERTVWWSWTATQTSPVIMESLDCPTNSTYVCMAVWFPNLQAGFPVRTNLFVAAGSLLCCTYVPMAVPHTYGIFFATNGATYFLQLVGAQFATNLFRFRLTASTAPVIKEQPIGLTVSSNATALFTVAVTGVPPVHYQWQFNDVDLPGATNTALLLTNVTPDQAGSYRALVSNDGGAVTSAVANLWISLKEVQPLLSVLRPSISSIFDFAVAGETGRSYRIESSLDLIQWTAEKSFDSGSLYYPPSNAILTSVVFK